MEWLNQKPELVDRVINKYAFRINLMPDTDTQNVATLNHDITKSFYRLSELLEAMSWEEAIDLFADNEGTYFSDPLIGEERFMTLTEAADWLNDLYSDPEDVHKQISKVVDSWIYQSQSLNAAYLTLQT